MPVIMYPEMRVAPNSGGSSFQPQPILEGNTALGGCPALFSQHMAAYFNVLIRRLLNYPEPAYAGMVEQAMLSKAEGEAAKEYVAGVVRKFIEEQRMKARETVPAAPPTPTPTPTPASVPAAPPTPTPTPTPASVPASTQGHHQGGRDRQGGRR